MSRATWKATERTIAGRLGGKRVPVSGRERGYAPDIAHDTLSIEVKHRKELPAWLRDAMDQAVKSARPGQTPVAILHEHGTRHAGDVCMIRLADLEALVHRATDTQSSRIA